MQSSVCSWADDENCVKNRSTKISWVGRHVSARERHFSFHSIMKTITANEVVRWTAIVAWKSLEKNPRDDLKTEMNFLALPRRRVQSGAEKDIMQKILILFVLCVISKSKGKLDFFSTRGSSSLSSEKKTQSWIMAMEARNANKKIKLKFPSSHIYEKSIYFPCSGSLQFFLFPSNCRFWGCTPHATRGALSERDLFHLWNLWGEIDLKC